MNYKSAPRHEVIDFLLKRKPGSCLEIGCGSGDTLHMLAREWSGYKHLGVDLFKNDKWKNTSIGNLQFVQSDATEFIKKHEINYDYVLALDIIEHIVEYGALFSVLSEKIKKEAVIVISVPNIRFLFSLYQILLLRDFPENDAGIFDRTHLRWFTKRKIMKILRNHGFEIDYIHGINSFVSVQPNIFRKVILSLLFPILVVLGRDVVWQQYLVVAKLSQ